MLKINKEDKLAKVSKYRLQRPDITFDIDVHEIIAGETLHSFSAIPRSQGDITPKEYCGFGESEADALEDCLDRIRDVDKGRLEFVDCGANMKAVFLGETR